MRAGRVFAGLIASVLITALALGPSAAAQDSLARSRSKDTQRREYIGSPSPCDPTGFLGGCYLTWLAICEEQAGIPVNIGAVCFEPTPGDFVKIEIEDATGLLVAGLATFISPGGNSRWNFGGPICGKSVKIPVEREWWMLAVYIAGPIETALWCGGLPATTPGTKGIVRATFITSRG